MALWVRKYILTFVVKVIGLDLNHIFKKSLNRDLFKIFCTPKKVAYVFNSKQSRLKGLVPRSRCLLFDMPGPIYIFC